ncbi:MAG: CcmD family protein [Planctomycetes bacterium]|nr:CcmD family protein [Planctomycetota bacterium]
MNRFVPAPRCTALAALLLSIFALDRLAPGPLYAQMTPAETPAPPGADSPAAAGAGIPAKVTVQELDDFRDHLMIAFSAVFVLIGIYLVLSHRKYSALRQEVEFMERRIAHLNEEAQKPAAPRETRAP